jgi:SAM-dependent methyltransferase
MTCEENSQRRFAFGRNWRRFLDLLNADRISAAEVSLKNSLDSANLHEKYFLDIGSGSGLFSLAARRLGAHVHSFDYDPESVACTAELKRRYFPDDPTWIVEQGSVLEKAYLDRLSASDVVYSWGVLHHTGDMWRGLGNLTNLVRPGGKLCIAIYNDQGRISRFWYLVKRFYCTGVLTRCLVIPVFVPYFFLRSFFIDLLRLKNPMKRYVEYEKHRGMSILTDWVDWLGGYPFEVAKPEEIFDFFKSRGFNLVHLKTAGGGLGNNEFVFERVR